MQIKKDAKILNSKILWLAVSLIAALTLWTYVTSQSSDEFKRTFRSVKVEFIGEEYLHDVKDMVITDQDCDAVTVEVVGPRRIVSKMRESDIVAQVDVSKLSQPAYTSQAYTVVFPDGQDVNALSITYKTPETINFMVSKLVSRPIQVRGTFDGSLAENYTAEAPRFEPTTITITGPEAYTKDIDHAWVTFGKEDVSQTYSEVTDYLLIGKDGEPHSTDGIQCSADTVTAILPVLRVKEVPLAVELLAGGGATSDDVRMVITPQSAIALVGDETVVERKSRIVLATIDLSSFTSSFTETYTIPLDDDVINMSGVAEATVTVEIVGLATKSFGVRGQDIACINVPEGYKCNAVSGDLRILLRGKPDEISNVKAANITASADIGGYKGDGTEYTAPVSIHIDGFPDVGVVGDYSVTVQMTRG